jgi:hypothetical protein
MSSEKHHGGVTGGAEPVHTDVAFEKRDVNPSSIYLYLIGLAVAVVVSYGVCILVLRVTTRNAVEHDTPPPPVRQEMGGAFQDLPPEPRLQGVPGHGNDPQADLREKLQEDTQATERLEWLDQNAGIAQIPVKDAMKIIAQKGLPGAPPAGKK